MKAASMMNRVEEELPLKQGLKQEIALEDIPADVISVEEELPLKQGLKQQGSQRFKREHPG